MYNAEQKQCTNNTVNMYCTASSDTFIGETLVTILFSHTNINKIYYLRIFGYPNLRDKLNLISVYTDVRWNIKSYLNHRILFWKQRTKEKEAVNKIPF